MLELVLHVKIHLTFHSFLDSPPLPLPETFFSIPGDVPGIEGIRPGMALNTLQHTQNVPPKMSCSECQQCSDWESLLYTIVRNFWNLSITQHGSPLNLEFIQSGKLRHAYEFSVLDLTCKRPPVSGLFHIAECPSDSFMFLQMTGFLF
jgi:hypothetical protein